MKQNITNLDFQLTAEKALSNNKNLNHTLIVFDIDRFHDIIDLGGYDTANEILDYIEGMLKTHITEPNLYCRICNDNFVILLQDYKDIDIALLVIQLTEEMSGYNSEIKLSFGISKADHNDTNISSLYQRAYYAKNTIKGKGRHLLGNFNDIVQAVQQTNLAVI